jgi:hypothetical protein
MARIRTIKPEFFTSEKIGYLTVNSRLLFVALWTQADREGRMRFQRMALAAACMPYEMHLFDGCLAELLESKLVVMYEVDNRKYLFLPGFLKHQKPHNTERKSELPPFNGELTVKQPLNNGEVTQNLRQERERERERERELTTAVGGGSGRDSCAGAEDPPAPPSASPPAIEEEVTRLRDLHLATCGLSTVPPVAMIREVLTRGKPVALIDDIYQAHGGDVPKYRQRNIVEELKRLRDGGEARASPGLGKARRKSAAELRQEAIYRESRAFALGIGRE